jgi:hypothetical protein
MLSPARSGGTNKCADFTVSALTILQPRRWEGSPIPVQWSQIGIKKQLPAAFPTVSFGQQIFFCDNLNADSLLGFHDR